MLLHFFESPCISLSFVSDKLYFIQEIDADFAACLWWMGTFVDKIMKAVASVVLIILIAGKNMNCCKVVASVVLIILFVGRKIKVYKSVADKQFSLLTYHEGYKPFSIFPII